MRVQNNRKKFHCDIINNNNNNNKEEELARYLFVPQLFILLEFILWKVKKNYNRWSIYFSRYPYIFSNINVENYMCEYKIYSNKNKLNEEKFAQWSIFPFVEDNRKIQMNILKVIT